MDAYTKHHLKHNLKRLQIFLKWIVFSILSGISIGLVGTAFYFCMLEVTALRKQYPALLYLLPVAGLLIVGIYKVLHNEKDSGTNLVLSAIHSGDNIPLRMAPSIFFSTLLTHLFGGSAGREGAALQLGGSIGGALGEWFGFDEKDQHIMIMCGMSAAFSALFGTPMAAAIFSMEVVSVGIMHYSALVPCVISSLVAHGVATFFGIEPEFFAIRMLPDFTIKTSLLIAILALACACVSILFCIFLHSSNHLFRKHLKNPYLRVSIGGLFVVCLTLLFRTTDYNGAGMDVIARCFETGKVVPYAFLLKMIFTAITLGSGYKGGEIVPSFFVGATFGCLFGNLIHFSPSLCAAVGMSAVFCGVTNCPISTLLISFELFGFEGMPYFLLSIALSYMLSGYYGLYGSQKIIYSKFKTQYINRKTH